MTNGSTRREELIAAVLAGELTKEEQREFEQACADDPGMLRDLQLLQGVSGRLAGSGLAWEERDAPPGLGDRVLAATDSGHFTAKPQPRRSRVLLLSAAAAALLIVGSLGGALITDRLQSPPDGPPGTLGAVEEIDFPRLPAGGAIDAALIAHTWGTETVLEVDGLAAGKTFEVVLLRVDGRELSSGSFIGTAQTVTCRMNAAVLRQDVSEVQIRDVSGAVVASSDVPEV